MKMLFTTLAVIGALAMGVYMGTNQACGEECVAGTSASIASLSVSEFNQELDSGEPTLIDIRTAEEYKAGHIAGSIQTDFYQTAAFTKFLEDLDKDKHYLIYCRSGNRSGQALDMMRDMGFSNVQDLSGGINAWTAAGQPTTN